MRVNTLACTETALPVNVRQATHAGLTSVVGMTPRFSPSTSTGSDWAGNTATAPWQRERSALSILVNTLAVAITVSNVMGRHWPTPQAMMLPASLLIECLASVA